VTTPDDPSPPPSGGASSASAASAPAFRPHLTLGLLGGIFAVHFLDRQLLAILIPPIQAELGLSDTAIGLLSGLAFTVFFSVVGLAIARLADRYDRARIITVSRALFSAMTALCGVATGFWQLFAARVGVGVGEGGTNPASHALIADLFPSRTRAAAMAAYGVGPHVGVLLAFGLGGWLAQSIGWRATFVVAGVVGLALALVAQFVLRDPRTTPGSGRATPPMPMREVVRALARSRPMRHLFAAATLAMATVIGALTWLPTLLTRAHGASLAHAGLLLALAFGVAGAFGTYATGRFADAVAAGDARRKGRFTAACQLALAAAWLPALLVDDSRLAVSLLLLPAVLTGAYVGPTLALMQDGADARARAFSAAVLLFVVNLVGASLGPLVIGLLSDALAAAYGPRSLSRAMLVLPVLAAWSAFHFHAATRAPARQA
jgi:predicted MFS family arabinose efflux permease